MFSQDRDLRGMWCDCRIPKSDDVSPGNWRSDGSNAACVPRMCFFGFGANPSDDGTLVSPMNTKIGNRSINSLC
jgi:hypothetical protein